MQNQGYNPVTLNVILTNRWAALQYCPDEVRDYWRFRPPGYFFSPLYRAHKWDGYVSMFKRGRVPAGLFLATYEQIQKEQNCEFVIDDTRERPPYAKTYTANEEDRYEFQDDCLDAMFRSSKTGGIILAGTGSGKTRIAGKYFKVMLGIGVFVVDELTLLKQAKADLEKVLGEKVGVIGKGEFSPKRISVATIQTLHIHREDHRFDPWMKSVDVIFLDELHIQLNRRNIDTLKSIPAKAVFGLTATLQVKKAIVRTKAFAMCGPIIYSYPLEQGVKDGNLTPGLVVGVDVEKAHVSHDYPSDYDDLIVDGKDWNHVVCRLARVGHDLGKHVLILVERVRHLKNLSKKLADIPHRTAFGGIPVSDREKAKKAFNKDKIRLLIANKVFKKGISIDAIDVIIECAAMKSPNDAQQKYGRGVRLNVGKDGLIFFHIGYKNPAQINQYSIRYNRFEKASRKARRALRENKVNVVKVKWEKNTKEIYRIAEKELAKVVRAAQKHRSKSRSSS